MKKERLLELAGIQLDENTKMSKDWRGLEKHLNAAAAALVRTGEAEDEDNAKEILADFCDDYINNVM